MKLQKKKWCQNSISSAIGIALLGCTTSAVLANGTETLGPPSINIESGTGTVAAGTGLIMQPGMIEIDVPGEIKQALLYWECQTNLEFNIPPTEGTIVGDDTIVIGDKHVTGELIGGPTKFFGNINHGDTYSSTFRADITDLPLVYEGMNTLYVEGLDCNGQINPSLDFSNNGAGLMVIYDDGSKTEAEIAIKDGNDLAFHLFAPPLDTTAAQTFTFKKSNESREAHLSMFFSSVSGTASGSLGFRPSAIEVTVGGTTTVYDDLLDSNDGDEWDTVNLDITIPENATMLTVQAISVDNPPAGVPGFPASFAWNAAALSVARPEEVCGRMKGGGKIRKTYVTHAFSVSCDVDKKNRLQVNWGYHNKFHLTSLDEAYCNDDPAIKQRRKHASFDTISGKGTGKYNGVDGAKVEFVFVDAGKHGRRDISEIKITDAKGHVVLDVSGNIRYGNHKALGCTDGCGWKRNRKHGWNHGWHRKNHGYQRNYHRSHYSNYRRGHSSRKWHW